MNISWKKTFLISFISTLSISLALFVYNLSVNGSDLVSYYLNFRIVGLINIAACLIVFWFYHSHWKKTLIKNNKLLHLINYAFIFSFYTLPIVFIINIYSSQLNIFILPLYYLIFILAIFSGSVYIWLNYDKLFTDDSYQKYTADKDKYIRLPIINTQIKYNSNEIIFYIILIIFLIAGFYLRVTNLTNLEPYTDEYIHLVNAKSILINYLPHYYIDHNVSQIYLRFFPLTISLALVFKVFGYSLFAARILGVLASTVTGYLLYRLFNKFNRGIALLIAILWLVSPWAIMISRNVREYAYMPIIYLVGFYLIYISVKYLKDYLINKFNGVNDRIKIKYPILFLLPISYALLDIYSTYKLIIFYYSFAILYLIIEILRSNQISRTIKQRLIIVTSFFVLAVITALIIVRPLFIGILPVYNDYWVNIFFNNSDTQWFYNSNLLGFYVLFAIGLLSLIILSIKSNFKFINSIAISFVIYFYFFTFHFSRYDRPRYGYIMLILILPIIAVGIQICYKIILHDTQHKKIHSVLYVFAILTVFNLYNAVLPLSVSDYGYVPITNEYHDSFLPVLEKYGKEINNSDPVICSLCFPLYWYNIVDLKNNNIYTYNNKDSDRFNKDIEIIKKYQHGWMILDERRNNGWSEGYPESNLFIGNKSVKFVDRIGSFYVYKW
jgi:hypothetical protein